MHWKKLLSLTTLLTSLSACALWTDFETPHTKQPDTWKTQADVSAQAWPDVNWWTQFNSPELTVQIQQAQVQNYDLKAAIARIRQADAQVRIAGAALLPSVEADADATRSKAASTGGSIAGLGSRSGSIRNSVTAELSASYEIDFWGKNWANAEAARQLAEASRYDWEVVNLETLSTVANNYFDILATKDRLAIAQDNLKNAQELMTAIRKRFEQGTASALDVAQQESVVATQGASVPPLELHLQQDLDAQAILLGKLPENMALPEQNMESVAVPKVGAGIPAELLERRPDVKEAEAQLASAHASIIVARAQFFPSISLTADGGYASSTLAHLFDPGSRLFSIGADLAQPIFEGGLLEGQLELAKARYKELLEDYRKTALSAYSDVENALVAMQKNAEQERAQKTAVDTARNAFELSEKQLNGGIVDITSVLNTQRTLFAAQDAYAQAQLAHLQAIVSLYQALGGGWKNGDSPEATGKAEITPAPDTLPASGQPPAPASVSANPPAITPLLPLGTPDQAASENK